MAHIGETKTESAVAVLILIGLEELVEHLALLGLGDSRAGIPDLDHKRPLAASDADENTTGFGELDRIGHEILDHAAQQLRIAIGQGQPY